MENPTVQGAGRLPRAHEPAQAQQTPRGLVVRAAALDSAAFVLETFLDGVNGWFVTWEGEPLTGQEQVDGRAAVLKLVRELRARANATLTASPE